VSVYTSLGEFACAGQETFKNSSILFGSWGSTFSFRSIYTTLPYKTVSILKGKYILHRTASGYT